jgi:glycerophosphoryl diester phosphodiesterase
MEVSQSQASAGASLAALLSSPQDPTERALAARYAPIIRFDEREPFLPLVAGYTVFRADADSPSFPRRIELHPAGRPAAALAIEYALWWDWDIGHLYELEHAWVYLGRGEQVIRAEASWHGTYHDMAVNGTLRLTDQRLRLYSEPGKHAFAPATSWLEERAQRTRRSCGRLAGAGGVHITPLFDGIITSKTPMADRLVHTYLERHAFEPSYQFNHAFVLPQELLVPWPALFEWIPDRVAWWVDELERTIRPSERRLLRIAHRGASAYAPENTLAAIAKAAELGADMVELDVQVSADGIPVILHDADLSRTTNGTGFVRDHSLAALKELDAGRGEQVPTLEEVILACVEHDLGLYLELKTGRNMSQIVDLIRRHGVERHTVFSSFRPDWLADVKALAPEIATAVLFGSVHIDPVALAEAAGAEYVHPAWENRATEPHQLLTDAWIARVRAAGLGIICWHEERPAEIAALRRLGVDGICSDTPDRLLL